MKKDSILRSRKIEKARYRRAEERARRGKPFRLDAKQRKIIRKEWPGMWKGHPCFIFGCGPSLNDLKPYVEEELEQYFLVGVNRAFKLMTPNLTFYQDGCLYDTEKKYIDRLSKKILVVYRKGYGSVRGIAYRQDTGPGWHLVPDILKLSTAKNSIPGVFEIAQNFGCNPIILCGVDSTDETTHVNFCGYNKFHRKKTMQHARAGLKWIRRTCKTENINLLCTSKNGILPYTPIEEVLDIIKDRGKGKDYYNKILLRVFE